MFNVYAFNSIEPSKIIRQEFVLPKTNAYRASETRTSNFRKFYNRGDFPMALEHDAKGNKIAWKVDVAKLDYQVYLPLFFDGLSETDHPYSFFANQGVHDMLAHGGHKVASLIHLLIGPIKSKN
ncbi:hypothetical protein HELRODRAFT_184607 [Helobdella robusta]|uniref:Uncharacterized protein n=1 Tax=Helobdella robusta TaxID=6412 RepID=T1FLK7_HELRO|nr:hypothetical protein HELRODRAFT_184607 [Helobdella robusta]ESO08710.1 hypothetical protein HELRODRAFT_184607 [Helobdella robusta]